MKCKKSNLIVFLLPTLLLFGLIFLIPMIMVFGSSFFHWKAGDPLEFVGLDNYIQGLFYDENMQVALRNTFIWVLLQSTVHVGIGTVCAFILARKFRGWQVFRTIFMIPNVISMAALGIIYLNLFSPDIGAVNAIISSVLGRTFQWNWYFQTDTAFFTVTLSWLLYAGLVTILILAGILAVPTDVLESARIDGATRWQVNTRIILPLIRTTLGTTVILSATSMLREFELIFLTTAGGPGNITLNLPLYLYKTSLTSNNYGYANMMGVVLIFLGVVTVAGINKLFRMEQSDM